MNRQRIAHLFIGLAMLLAAEAPVSAQHGGHGGHGGHFSGHGGGHFGGHGGHFGGHLGHDFGHGLHHGVFGHDGHHFDHHGFALYSYGYGYPYSYGYGYPSYGGAYYSAPLDYESGYRAVGPLSSTEPNRVEEGDAETEAGRRYLEGARDAFRSGGYQQAVRLSGHAAVEMSRNADVHQFTSLALFALAEYRGAASAAHAALALGDPWDWQAVRTYYGNSGDYTSQLRALEQSVRENPDDPAATFLLGYHYLMLGHQDAAVKKLQRAVELSPGDELAQRLLQSIGGTPERTSPQRTTPSGEDRGHQHDHGSHDHSHGGDASPTLPDSTNRTNGNADVGQTVEIPETMKGIALLAASDQVAALKQKTCPVTGDLLGSVGKPYKVQIGERTVFVCCEGCIEELKAEPQKFLADLQNGR